MNTEQIAFREIPSSHHLKMISFARLAQAFGRH
jgi:hypothetical protein